MANVVCGPIKCPVLLNSACVFYEGSNLPNTGITTNNSIEQALIKIDASFSSFSGGHIIQYNGTDLPARTYLNFVGAGVIATDDSGNNATLITINGGGGSADWGSIGAGTGVGSQTDLITYLNSNYYPLVLNPAGYITDLSSFTTDDLLEGVTNLYFTNSRAITALTGQNISIFNNDVPYLTSISLQDLTVSTGLQLNIGTTYNTSATRTISIDNTVVTLTGSQALSNKTGLISQWSNDSNYITLASTLSGLSISGSTINSGNSVIQAFGALQNQINGILGGAIYQGTWNALTNSPILVSSTGTKGYYYVVNVAGSTNLDGITDWKIGDWVIFNGLAWEKVDNTDAVSSVNGAIGAVVITTTGTVNRISVSGGSGLTPTIDIDSAYVGQISITTLGTITTGLWQGSSISTTYTDAKIQTVTGTTNRISIGGTSTDPIFNVPDNAQLNIAKITNLTSNGFVKTSGGDGTLSVDTNTYTPTGSAWLLASGGTATGTNTFIFGTNPWLITSDVSTGTAATAGMRLSGNSLTSGNLLEISTTSLTSGKAVSVISTSTAINHTTGTNALFSSRVSGANANINRTAIAGEFVSTNTNATSGTNIGIYASASGATTANYAGYFDPAIRIANGANTLTLSSSGTMNSSGNIALQPGGSTAYSVSSVGAHTFAQVVQAGNTNLLNITTPVHTGGIHKAIITSLGAYTAQTASSDLTDIDLNLARIVQANTGAVTARRAIRIQPPTYSFIGASTITTAATLSIDGPPVAGTNATITNNFTLHIASGNTGLGGRLGVGLVTTPQSRLHVLGEGTTTGSAFLVEDLSSVDRFEILDNGQINVGGSAGTSGQLLTSSGTGSSPTWNSPKTLLLFDYYTDATVGGAETDIYSSTLAANQFNANGDKVIATYGGNFVTVGTELTQLKVYLAGTAIWDSTGVAPTTGTTSWNVDVKLIRVSSTVVRYTVTLNTTGASGFVYATSGELTGLTLSGTNILKITGTSSGVGSGAGDIVGKMGYVEFKIAA